jgi:23S rRNA (guanosine2251-2'-O)-methyltransferase
MATYLAGRNAVFEALQAGRRVRRVLVDDHLRENDPEVRRLLEAAAAGRIPVERVSRGRLDAIHPRHQGVAAEVEPFAYTPFADLKARTQAAGEAGLVLALDELQDPQNLGTLLRTTLAVNATGVVIPERRGVGVTPAVVRASAGAAEHLTISLVPNLVRALGELQALGLWVVGLDVRGGRPYDETDLRGPLVLVVGSEGAGLRRLVRERCDLLVHLPMAGPTESLNAAVAGSITLYHIFRLRGRGSAPGLAPTSLSEEGHP